MHLASWVGPAPGQPTWEPHCTNLALFPVFHFPIFAFQLRFPNPPFLFLSPCSSFSSVMEHLLLVLLLLLAQEVEGHTPPPVPFHLLPHLHWQGNRIRPSPDQKINLWSQIPS